MTGYVKAALILACSLIVASILFGGIYESRNYADGLILWRVNRFTGNVEVCTGPIPGGPDKDKIPACSEARETN